MVCTASVVANHLTDVNEPASLALYKTALATLASFLVDQIVRMDVCVCGLWVRVCLDWIMHEDTVYSTLLRVICETSSPL